MYEIKHMKKEKETLHLWKDHLGGRALHPFSFCVTMLLAEGV